MIDAAEAKRIGLVNRLAAPGEVPHATEQLVEELLANSQLAVGRAKRVIDASARPALAQSLELEVAVQAWVIQNMTNARAAFEADPARGPQTPQSPQLR